MNDKMGFTDTYLAGDSLVKMLGSAIGFPGADDIEGIVIEEGDTTGAVGVAFFAS